MKEKASTCKTCKHWHNKQRDLNYWKTTGFCLNGKFSFNSSRGRLIGVVDLLNQKDKIKVSGNPSHDFETKSDNYVVNPSRYLLQTEEDFGCIFHEV